MKGHGHAPFSGLEIFVLLMDESCRQRHDRREIAPDKMGLAFAGRMCRSRQYDYSRDASLASLANRLIATDPGLSPLRYDV
jgi:hypothetical protein